MAVVIETTLGDIAVDLFIEERPKACLNFLKLCKLKYYNYNLFHNIEQGFIAQTGDPTGAGDGGKSVWGVVEGAHKNYFEAESIPKIKHTTPGLVSMVSVGKNMVGSQFFFTLGNDLISLDGVHCVIGEVAEGFDVLRKLNEAIVDDKYRPYQDIRITHTVVLEDPFEDPRGFQIPSRSPSPSAERLKNGRIGADEDIDDTEGKTTQQIQEMLQEREAQARAIILEIVGDLPDADIAPPENVLFICKLNPVTNDDDLEIIFSRFGKVKGCEVIRDKVTGDSLQYAFVEFEDKKSCENAFFKMDNVLIDDRRIHVDFSQSVAKVKWRGKGRGIIRADGREGGKLDFDNLRQGTNVRSNTKDSSYKKQREHANDRGRNKKVMDEKPPRRQTSRSRSTSRDRPRSKHRSRSRSPAERGRNRQDSRYDRQSKDTFRREKLESRTRSPPHQTNRSRDHEYRRYDHNSRDARKPYDHRTRERHPRSHYDDFRNDSRKQQSRRSRSRSPRRPYRERSPVRNPKDTRPPKSRESESRKFESSHARREDRKRDLNRNRAESARSHSSPQSPKERHTSNSATSKRNQKEYSSGKNKNISKKPKRKARSSTSASDSSSASSSESSSSEEERRKRKKKVVVEKASRKKSKKSKSSSSSSESSSE